MRFTHTQYLVFLRYKRQTEPMPNVVKRKYVYNPSDIGYFLIVTLFHMNCDTHQSGMELEMLCEFE